MKELSNKQTGDRLQASEFDQPMKELENIIESTGVILTESSLDQVNTAISRKDKMGNYMQAAGGNDHSFNFS